MRECLIILKKELLEIFRDRSTFVILLIPAFVFPMLTIGLNYLNKDSNTQINISITYDNQEAKDIFSDFLLTTPKYDINVIDTDEKLEALKAGEIDCYINISDKHYNFVYNSSSYNSMSLTIKLGEEFQRYYNSMMIQLHDDYYQMNLIDENSNIANASNSVSSIFVPIILIMLIFQNSSSFANDIFAGEKE